MSAATAAHQKILISFEHSHRSNSRALKAPTVAAYTKELKKFKAAYPGVREISPWNEVNRCHALRDGSVAGPADQDLQPDHRPKLTAQYYCAARKVFTGSKYRIVGLDILDEQNVNKTIKYLQSFLRHASPDPKIIGFHNYSDTNRFSTTRTKRVLAAFRGKVWLTETGGIVKLGSALPVQHEPRGQGAGLHVQPRARPTRASSALYVYQFNAPPRPATPTSTPA